MSASQSARDTFCVHSATYLAENESRARAESLRAYLVCVRVAFPLQQPKTVRYSELPLLVSRIFGDESALIRRGYLRRSGRALPHASGGVPPNGSNRGEPVFVGYPVI